MYRRYLQLLIKADRKVKIYYPNGIPVLTQRIP